MLHVYTRRHLHHIHEDVYRRLTLNPLLRIIDARVSIGARVSRREPAEAERAVLDDGVIQLRFHRRRESHVSLLYVARVHSCVLES